MLKHSLRLCTSSRNLSKLGGSKTYCTQTKVLKWDLLSAICIERHPIISCPRTELEENYQNLLDQIELENSMKCDHELREEDDIKTAEKIKKGLVHVDPDKVSLEKARDIEDRGDAELATFKMQPRITEADKKNIKTSLDRKLDKSLLLVVQQKVGEDTFWLPPQGLREEGENMREAAERILKNTCGENLNIKIYGNAPVGFYKYAYPRSMRRYDNYGAKIFYYMGKYIDGDISTEKNIKYQWLDRQELETMIPKPIYKSVSQFLIPEHPIEK